VVALPQPRATGGRDQRGRSHQAEEELTMRRMDRQRGGQ
jgi:hypothetical protein